MEEQIIEAIIQRIKDEEKKHSKSIEDWYRIAANKIYATFDIKIKEKMSNKKQHFIVIEPNTGGFTIEKKIEKWTNDGWKITSVTPQYVSTGSTTGTSGGYLILIEKENEQQ